MKGSKASAVTIQGDIVVEKFLALKGPNGTYSHTCISLALQSLSKQKPKIWLWASFSFTGVPNSLDLPTNVPISSSISNLLHSDQTGVTLSKDT